MSGDRVIDVAFVIAVDDVVNFGVIQWLAYNLRYGTALMNSLYKDKA